MAGTIYGLVMSTCAQRIMVVANEVGAEQKIHPVDVFKGEHKQPAHLARQPFGKIPAWESEDGKVKLFESRAVARYIDAKTGGKLAHKDTLENAALVDVWCSVETANFDKTASTIVSELVFSKFRGAQPNEEEVKKAKATISPILDVYEKELATRSYLAGDSLSLADLFHLPYGAHMFRVAPDLYEGRPHLKKWFESLESLPCWKKTLETK